MDMRSWKPLALTLGISAASISYANADVDIDNDGLIEISTLEQLDLMRYDLAGTSLNGDSTGCPSTGCNGYELVADLDFDTNGNGIADAGDQFWNGGEGWLPVGDTAGAASFAQKKVSGAFTGDFDGNGFVISNLHINRVNRAWVGFFANMHHSEVSDVVFNNASVTGSIANGILSGGLNDSEVSRVRIRNSQSHGTKEVGLLSGRVFGIGTTIRNINVQGSVSGTHYTAGVIGWFNADNYKYGNNKLYLTDVISESVVESQDYTGCIVGVGRGVVATNLVSNCATTVGRNFVGSAFASLEVGAASNVVMKGDISGHSSIGGIIGKLNESSLTKANATGGLISGSYPGALVGHVVNSSVSDSISSVAVTGYGVSGAFNKVQHEVNISNVYSKSQLNATKNRFGNKAGLIYSIYYNATTVDISGSYWDVDSTGTSYSANEYGEGKTTSELQCPTIAGDAMCDASLYADWDETIWDFGTSYDYPVLR